MISICPETSSVPLPHQGAQFLASFLPEFATRPTPLPWPTLLNSQKETQIIIILVVHYCNQNTWQRWLKRGQACFNSFSEGFNPSQQGSTVVGAYGRDCTPCGPGNKRLRSRRVCGRLQEQGYCLGRLTPGTYFLQLGSILSRLRSLFIDQLGNKHSK